MKRICLVTFLIVPVCILAIDYSGKNYLTVDVDNICLLENSSIDSETIRTIDKGEKLVLLEVGIYCEKNGHNGNWVIVLTDLDPCVGWLFSDSLMDTNTKIEYGIITPFLTNVSKVFWGKNYNRDIDSTYKESFTLPLVFAKIATSCTIIDDQGTVKNIDFKPSGLLKSYDVKIDSGKYTKGRHNFSISVYWGKEKIGDRVFSLDIVKKIA